MKRYSCALLAASVLLATVALPAAAAVNLPANCNRQSPHALVCRMFVERSTPSQGRYTCRKLVRVVPDPATVKILITGSSRWTCR